MHRFGEMRKMAEGGDVATNAIGMFQQCVATNSKVIFSQTVDLIELKFWRKVSVVLNLMHDKNKTNPMYKWRDIRKMAEGDNVDFITNHAPGWAEI